MLCKQVCVVAFLIPRRWALFATQTQQSAHPNAEMAIPVTRGIGPSYHLDSPLLEWWMNPSGRGTVEESLLGDQCGEKEGGRIGAQTAAQRQYPGAFARKVGERGIAAQVR